MMDTSLLLLDLFRAYYDARRNKRNTHSQIAFEEHMEANLFGLYDELCTGTYYSEAKEDLDIAGWSRLRHFQSYRDDQTHDTIQWTANSNSIGFTGTDIVLDLTPHIAERKKQSTNGTAQQAYLITGATYQLIITQANSRFDDSNLVDSLGGYLLVK